MFYHFRDVRVLLVPWSARSRLSPCFPANKWKTERSRLPVCQRLFPGHTTSPSTWTCTVSSLTTHNSEFDSNLRFYTWLQVQCICLCLSGSAVVQATIATAGSCPAGALTVLLSVCAVSGPFYSSFCSVVLIRKQWFLFQPVGFGFFFNNK